MNISTVEDELKEEYFLLIWKTQNDKQKNIIENTVRCKSLSENINAYFSTTGGRIRLNLLFERAKFKEQNRQK